MGDSGNAADIGDVGDPPCDPGAVVETTCACECFPCAAIDEGALGTDAGVATALDTSAAALATSAARAITGDATLSSIAVGGIAAADDAAGPAPSALSRDGCASGPMRNGTCFHVATLIPIAAMARPIATPKAMLDLDRRVGTIRAIDSILAAAIASSVPLGIDACCISSVADDTLDVAGGGDTDGAPRSTRVTDS